MIIFKYTEPDMKVLSLKECKKINKKGVYVFRDKYDKPLYIGKANTFSDRMYSFIGGHHRLHFNPNEEVNSIDLYFIEDEEMRIAYEYFLINYLNPVYNTAKIKDDGKNICIDKEGLFRAGLKDDVEFINDIEKVYLNKFVRLAKRYRIASNNLRRANKFENDIISLKDEILNLNEKNAKLIDENIKLNEIVESFRPNNLIKFTSTINFSETMEQCVSLVRDFSKQYPETCEVFGLDDFFDKYDTYRGILESINFTSNVYLQFTPEISLGDFMNFVGLLRAMLDLDNTNNIKLSDKELIYRCIEDLRMEYHIFVRNAYIENAKEFGIYN